MDRNAAVAFSAYRKWEEAGKPENRDLDFWLAAEREFRQRAVPIIRRFMVVEDDQTNP